MSEDLTKRSPRGQWMVLGGVFAGIVLLLGVGYFLFLRTDYVVLAEGLRPADASAVVAELDKAGRPYRLSDGGATILVPADQADATRVAIAGSDVAARGEIGFELFNKSDMGLTNFAQKINYQRALQGELVRTIIAMEGVESARVHLALPERTLFRGDRAEPKAAVTVTMKPGQSADPARVLGIQRLVAAAVPDLPEAKVVVLDGSGRVISAAPPVETEEVRGADIEERQAVEHYYRARARGEIERRLPTLKFDLRVLALPVQGATPAAAGESTGWTPSGEGANRNFRLRFILVTETGLAAEEQDVARGAVIQASGSDLANGDTLLFQTGPIEPPAPVTQPSAAPLAAAPAMAPPSQPALRSDRGWTFEWFAVSGLLAAAAVLLWMLRGRRRTRLAPEEHEAFADRLRRQLNLADEADAVA